MVARGLLGGCYGLLVNCFLVQVSMLCYAFANVLWGLPVCYVVGCYTMLGSYQGVGIRFICGLLP